jgi:hypothetical protein
MLFKQSRRPKTYVCRLEGHNTKVSRMLCCFKIALKTCEYETNRIFLLIKGPSQVICISFIDSGFDKANADFICFETTYCIETKKPIGTDGADLRGEPDDSKKLTNFNKYLINSFRINTKLLLRKIDFKLSQIPTSL